MANTRDRLVEAAFELFAQQGFDRTTVEEIAARAGVGRTTFFRLFPAKEAVIFPDHDALLAAVDARLAAADRTTATVAVAEAARLVLRHYLEEGEVARERYELTRTVSALRDAEIAGQRRYQRLFREHLRGWLDGPGAPLRAEVLANAVVTAHNHVLRDWLRGESSEPEAALSAALADFVPRLWSDAPRGATPGGQIVVLRSDRDVEELLPRLRRLLAE
ncbi:TetR family transcriptional regulator [Nocardioides sp.]|uniref:TetR family transcriptional regulator n=1 Tax=Nocardioides sp. TaxID=35761 RepID=UPI0039E22308